MVKKMDQHDPELNRLIDKNLKRAFDTLANEPVPDRFTSLLDQLRSGEKKDPKGSADDDNG
ncbi:MAG: hypothetical protein EX266_05715 [Rhodobacteraceae bacterium]|nr:MAG: hypothetical protein EX266_05715 [Paracoccaceae bacterium]